MSNPTVRRFVFTWNNYTSEDYDKCCEFIKSNCRYGIVGKEIAPTTGCPHLQGFCNLHKPMRFGAIKKHLHNSIHIEKANGSDEDNKKYCSKSGETFEQGHPHKQGERTDLQSCISDIQSGATIKKIAEDHPAVFIRYHRGIREYIRTVMPIKERDFKTEVYYYWGPPGSGKSKRALEEAKQRGTSIYYKPRGLWWDGYQQHDCVIIDDFYGWIKYDEMLKIMDRYPYKVQIKGGFEEFTSKYIWITSNVDTDDLYKFIGYKTDALERRITNKEYMD
ncbi:capsid [Bat associated cyclovirus 12]|uniref:Replication-associated protein n=5 Tax=Circoviridae TaxID=39724 RepID=A0A0A0YN47_9CIRC|nr:capsid [Bat circovirus POA/2012/II]AIX11623.1 capsid [Bat circovirus POA/2012/II]